MLSRLLLPIDTVASSHRSTLSSQLRMEIFFSVQKHHFLWWVWRWKFLCDPYFSHKWIKNLILELRAIIGFDFFGFLSQTQWDTFDEIYHNLSSFRLLSKKKTLVNLEKSSTITNIYFFLLSVSKGEGPKSSLWRSSKCSMIFE